VVVDEVPFGVIVGHRFDLFEWAPIDTLGPVVRKREFAVSVDDRDTDRTCFNAPRDEVPLLSEVPFHLLLPGDILHCTAKCHHTLVVGLWSSLDSKPTEFTGR
jgi:hypothetical protein